MEQSLTLRVFKGAGGHMTRVGREEQNAPNAPPGEAQVWGSGSH